MTVNVRMQFNFDKSRWKLTEGQSGNYLLDSERIKLSQPDESVRINEYWTEWSPALPAGMLALYFEDLIHSASAEKILRRIEFIRNTGLDATKADVWESGFYELVFFGEYILLDQMYPLKTEQWWSVLLTRQQLISLLRSLHERLICEQFEGVFSLEGQILSYGTQAKRDFLDLAGYWDDREDELSQMRGKWSFADFLGFLRGRQVR